MNAPRAHVGAGRDDRRQRQVLIGLALLFFAPVGLSFYLYYGHSALQPGRRVNVGDLVQPPRPMPAAALTRVDGGSAGAGLLLHKWTLLYVDDGACAARCREALYDTRQVRLSLDRDMDRVQRLFIAAGACCESDLLSAHPDLIVVRQDAAAAPLVALLPADGGPAEASRRVYLVDPLGNLMMFYAPDAKPKGMLEDLKRLLRLSHIG